MKFFEKIKRLVKNKEKFFLIPVILFVVLMGGNVLATIQYASIDNTYKYAWGENVGWINFSGVKIDYASTTLSGYAYGENIGFISMNCQNTFSCADNSYVVTNANYAGDLDGYAWGENVGWIDFDNVVIDLNTGLFEGFAWGENIGFIVFGSSTENNSVALAENWAAPLNVGTINSCGTIVSSGTYTFASDINATGTCLTIVADNVVIDGAGYGLIGDGTGIGINASGINDGQNGFGTTTISNLTISNFATGTDASGRDTSRGIAGNGGNILFENSTTTLDLVSNGGDVTGVNGLEYKTGGKGGNITISNTNFDGSVENDGGSILTDVDVANSISGGNGGVVSILNSVVSSEIISGSGGAGLFAPGTNAGTGGNGGLLYVLNSTVATSTSGIGGNGISAGLGGSINITDSTTTKIISGNGGNGNNQNGQGGSITISDSVNGFITSGNGGVGSGTSADGGNILITSTDTLNLASKTITAGLGTSGVIDSTSGTLELIYAGILTNSSTYFYKVSDLVINSLSYGAWNAVFNPVVYYYNNATGDGNWNNLNNWWNSADFTGNHPAQLPQGYHQVFVSSNVSTGIGAVADTITFLGTSTSAIDITVTNNAEFKEQSTNTGTTTSPIVSFFGSSTNLGQVVSDLVTFWENFTSTTGGNVATSTPDGLIQRIFSQSATTTRNFTTEGGRSDWIIKGLGQIIVDVSGAVYDLANNTFQALSGAVFTWGSNSAGQPAPVISITSPTSGTNAKWAPVVDWDNSVDCKYSYDGFVSSFTVVCANNGSDIPRPTAGNSKTLSVRSVDSNGNYAETSVTYTYDNTLPTYTLCGSDLLDEATRPYYYLSGNVTGNCIVTVDTEIRGSATTTTTINNFYQTSGYTITGNVIATSSNQNGLDITLRNVTVTGTTTASGGLTGKDGGNIYVYYSNVGPIIANGGNNASGNAGNAGSVIATDSITGYMEINGGDSTGSGNGGNAGNATSTRSLANPVTATLSANGGNALVCGYGGNGGVISLTDSTYGLISASAGSDQVTTGPGLCPTPPSGNSGQSGSVVKTGVYTPPSSGNTSTPSNVGGSQSSSLLRNLFNNPGQTNFTPLPEVNFFDQTGTYNPENVGVTVIPYPFQNFKPVQQFVPTPIVSFRLSVSQFLFAPLPETITRALSQISSIANVLQAANITKEQDLASLTFRPLELKIDDEVPPGHFVIKSGETKIATYVVYDQSIKGIAQLVKLSPNQSINISLIPVSTGEVTATYLDQTLTFNQGSQFVDVNITTPTNPGRYIIKTSSSPTPLLLEVVGGVVKEPNQESKPWGVFNFVWRWFNR